VAEPGDRRPVGPTTVARDVVRLRQAIRWLHEKARRIDHDPLVGYEAPKESSPRRPVATEQRYAKTMEVAHQVDPALPVLLTLARHTGRRIGAICALTLDDLRLSPTDVAPYGAVVWPRDTDKLQIEWHAPLHPEARSALDGWLAHPECGEVRLFPGVDRHVAAGWLLKAEELAELEKLDGSLWHAYRRLWATERMHLPGKAVAKAGGWIDVRTMERSYIHAPDEATRDAVLLADR
jgi:integrase